MRRQSDHSIKTREAHVRQLFVTTRIDGMCTVVHGANGNERHLVVFATSQQLLILNCSWKFEMLAHRKHDKSALIAMAP